MNDKPQNEYLRAKIMTATPQQLQTMLYDGAIRFCEQARAAIAQRDIATTHARIIRAQRIMIELTGGLRTELEPEICSRMASLYNYIYRLLIDAHLNLDLAKIDEALRLLQHIRETWLMALERARQENAAGSPLSDMAALAAELPDYPGRPAAGGPGPQRDPQATPGGILSIEG